MVEQSRENFIFCKGISDRAPHCNREPQKFTGPNCGRSLRELWTRPVGAPSAVVLGARQRR